MPTHPFGYIAVIVLQQVAIVGLAWWIAHLLERPARPASPRAERGPASTALASHDLAVLALQLEEHSKAAPSADWNHALPDTRRASA